MREFLFCSAARVVCRRLLECRFGRVTERSLRAKQTAVAYGWDVQRSATSEPRGGGGARVCRECKNLTCLCLMAWSVTFSRMLAAAAAPLGIH